MRSAGPFTARPPISGLIATQGALRRSSAPRISGDREDRPDRDVRIARRDQDHVRRVDRLDDARARARPSARPCSAPRRPRRGGHGRRTRSGTGTSRQASRGTFARDRRSRAGAAPPARARVRSARSPRVSGIAVAQELRAHEMQADVAVAELEPGLAAELRDRSERLPGLVGPAPAALLVGEARSACRGCCPDRARRAGPSTSMSSATLPTMETLPGSTTPTRPRRNRAPPTPPERTATFTLRSRVEARRAHAGCARRAERRAARDRRARPRHR